MYTALKQAGIEIPFPQRDLHLRSISDEAGAMLATRPPPAATESG
jgi:small-conductance mechanosensitive channel